MSITEDNTNNTTNFTGTFAEAVSIVEDQGCSLTLDLGGYQGNMTYTIQPYEEGDFEDAATIDMSTSSGVIPTVMLGFCMRAEPAKVIETKDATPTVTVIPTAYSTITAGQRNSAPALTAAA